MNKTPANRRRALGKGLTALLPQGKQAVATQHPAVGGALEIPVDAIAPNPLQPRMVFQPDRLSELAQSIKANGVIQPLVVRRAGDGFELVAGERRWRASRMAGLKTVPVVVQDLADEKLLEITLIENIQREDLNPIEIAQAFDRMGRQLNLSHEQIGQRTGKDRSTITNTLRLLRLPDEIQVLLAERQLNMGHARAILGLPTPELQRQFAEKAVSQGMSVRQVERLVQRMTEPREPKDTDDAKPDPNVKAAVERLESLFGTRVRIVQTSAQRGRLEIEFYSQDDLQRIYELIAGEENDS